jgi:hypothetical protein
MIKEAADVLQIKIKISKLLPEGLTSIVIKSTCIPMLPSPLFHTNECHTSKYNTTAVY